MGAGCIYATGPGLLLLPVMQVIVLSTLMTFCFCFASYAARDALQTMC